MKCSVLYHALNHAFCGCLLYYCRQHCWKDLCALFYLEECLWRSGLPLSGCVSSVMAAWQSGLMPFCLGMEAGRCFCAYGRHYLLPACLPTCLHTHGAYYHAFCLTCSVPLLPVLSDFCSMPCEHVGDAFLPYYCTLLSCTYKYQTRNLGVLRL
jgi:hypothetical protein